MFWKCFWKAVGWTYVGLLAVFLVAPILLIVVSSFSASEFLEFPPEQLTGEWYPKVISDSGWSASAMASLRIALASAVIATLCGLPIAIAHYRFNVVSPTVRLFFLLPLAIPSIILATGLFAVLLRTGGLATEWILILTGAATALPMVLITLIAAFSTLDPLLWTAAASLGAKPLRILVSIILPLVSISIVMAMFLGFQHVWDESTFAIFIGPIVTPTLTSKMFSYLQQNITPEIAAVASLLLLLTLIGAVVMLYLSKWSAAMSRRP